MEWREEIEAVRKAQKNKAYMELLFRFHEQSIAYATKLAMIKIKRHSISSSENIEFNDQYQEASVNWFNYIQRNIFDFDKYSQKQFHNLIVFQLCRELVRNATTHKAYCTSRLFSNVIVLEEDERDDRLLGEARHFNHSQPTTIDDPFEMVAAHQLYERTKDNLKANWAQTFDEHLGMSKVKTTKSRKLNWLHRDKIKSEMNRVMS